ncbi:hypothetical protein GIW50_19430 [Pseudomonas syringae]|uniref:Uncharacterized protein n=1 Tax=Pseudomonas syringae TaxID=317 RepID=A0A9Q3XAM5_PSESX|nr:hypothetical protein [Pseudomonas syringae]MCF5065557.1 hypothetical protein [Pseudomonas syringae]MCF5075619.1 hypothetical protein [Pseudomonas syringae]MCF5120560.1 hypothetical protein [Pseudomonas syringae]MCF5380649.1 hypothetical protein [Pseudomonas syringae]
MTRITSLFGGFTDTLKRSDSLPSSKTLSTAGSSASSSSSSMNTRVFDQKTIDKKIEHFNTKGQSSAPKTSTDTANTAVDPQLNEYKAKHQLEWQARKDATVRDTLFKQPVSGRVRGAEVEPFSSSKLQDNAEALVKADAKVKDAATPFSFKNAYKTALVNSSVTVPFTITAFVTINILNQGTNNLINPTSPAATEQSLAEGRLVEQSQRDVFQVVNTLGTLRGEPPVKPSLQWLAQTNDERLDTLEEMVDHVEQQIGTLAQKLEIPFQLASTGAPEDDIKSRTLGIDSRLAVLSALFLEMKNKLETSAG